MSLQLQDVLNRALKKTGQLPGVSLPTATSDAQAMVTLNELLEYENDAIFSIWDYYKWPESVTVEGRAFAPVYDYNTVYPLGAIVYDPVTAAYWQNIKTDGLTIVTTPLLNTGGVWATPVSNIPKLIPLTSPNRQVTARPDITGITTGASPLVGIATASSATAQGQIYALNLGLNNWQVNVSPTKDVNLFISPTGWQFWIFFNTSTVPAGAMVGTPVKPTDYNVSTNNAQWYPLPYLGLNETPLINQITDIARYDPRLTLSLQTSNYQGAGIAWAENRIEDYYLVGSNIMLPANYPLNTAFLEIKLPVPIWTLTAYVGGTTYTAGQQVFYLGETYNSLTGSNTGNTPSTSPLSWQLQPFPQRFAEYAALSAVADWKEARGLKEQDQNTARAKAEGARQDLFENLTNSENQNNWEPDYVGRRRRRHSGWVGAY